MLRGILISSAVFIAVFAYGQEVRDFGIWGTVSYGADISDNVDVSISQEVRMEQNASKAGVIFSDFGLDYRFTRRFQIGLNYRFILNDRANGLYGHRHRVMLDLHFRERVKRWTFAYRARGQSEVRTWNYSDEFGFAPTLDLRNTTKTVFRVNRRVEVYGSFDLRILWRDVRLPDFRGIDRYRYRLGTEYMIAQKQFVGVFVQYQREINVLEPEVEFTIGVEYKFGSRRQLMQN